MHVTHHTIQRLFRIRSELQEVYWNLLIQTFAKSLIAIFIPIYLLTIGFTLQSVLIFALLFYSTLGVFSLFSAYLSVRWGFKHQIVYCIPLFTIFYMTLVCMQFIPNSFLLLAITGIIGGISSAMYWVPLNSEFVKNTKKIHEGEEVAMVVAIPKLATILAPTAAAVILTLFGFFPLFVLVILIFLLSLIPLFATSDYKPKFTLTQEKRLLVMNKRLAPHLFLRGILYVSEFFLWPIFIFLTLHDFLDVGMAASAAAVGIAFFTYITGKLTDKGHRETVKKIGGVAYCVVWILRMFASTQMEILLLSFMGGMVASLIEVTVFSSFCDRARGKKVLNWVVSREVLLAVGRILMIILLLLVLGLDIRASFAIASVASILFLFI